LPGVIGSVSRTRRVRSEGGDSQQAGGKLLEVHLPFKDLEELGIELLVGLALDQEDRRVVVALNCHRIGGWRCVIADAPINDSNRWRTFVDCPNGRRNRQRHGGGWGDMSCAIRLPAADAPQTEATGFVVKVWVLGHNVVGWTLHLLALPLFGWEG